MNANAKLSEKAKVDIGLRPESLASTNATGEFFNLAKYGKALFAAEAGAMAAGGTVALQLRQAKDGQGDGAKDIEGHTATITANTKVAAATIVGDAVVDGNTFTVNGVVFTCKDVEPDIGAGEFASGADDAAAMANAAAAVNHLLPELKATSATDTMTIVAREPGEATVTLSALTATRFVGATLRALAYLEMDSSMLDHTNGFTHAAIRATTSGTILVSASLLRGDARYSPAQHAAASKVSL